ncbi:hypothetical protein J2W49_003956 [Hydrogenophaga palleronii]|uniref:Transposase n=1 Tax=Hydrogenophaga palleronii TaxID=65655 RepID=A0ABU1WRP3_9BURK|nr:hypothetical protein [Hydrogenophaga palleronii]MDR7151980.1 hypothetical protein [Hydrogenophaga palleronii]
MFIFAVCRNFGVSPYRLQGKTGKNNANDAAATNDAAGRLTFAAPMAAKPRDRNGTSPSGSYLGPHH